jgi:hypothetical protein
LRSNSKAISLADLLISAQAKKYARQTMHYQELLIATSNHDDFPPILFDLVHTEIVKLKDGKLKIVGFYRFSQERFYNLNNKKI